MEELEKRIAIIESRNRKVESDKAWGTSFFRKLIIAMLTYFTIVLFFVFAGLQRPFVNSIFPAVGFVLSTLSLPFFEKLWIKCRK